MTRASLCVPLLVSVFLCGCGSNEARDNAGDPVAAVQRLIDNTMRQDGVPGMAVAVVRDGEVIVQVTSGFADLGARTPVTAQTPFQLASTTKPFASTGVMLLVADGRLTLDDRVGAHIDGLPASWRDVTIRQLLSHTSGLPDVTRTPGELDLVADAWEEALPLISNAPLQFAPGERWAYTQTNYALLLKIVENISGQPFETFLENRMFGPLGMHNTFFPSAERSCAVSYESSGTDAPAVRAQLVFPHYVHAAGGLCTSLEDMIRWNAALDRGEILPAALAAEMWTPAVLRDGSPAMVNGPIAYGLGWALDTSAGHRSAGHSGGNSTAFRRYQDDHLTIIVLHNGAAEPDSLVASVASAVLDPTGAGNAQAALWDASRAGDVDAVLAALERGADPNALDTRGSPNGRRALNWAAINNHPEVIRELLAHGADIEGENLTGFTALQHAAENGSLDAVRALLAAGANTTHANGSGETAAQIARRVGHEDIARAIEENGSR